MAKLANKTAKELTDAELLERYDNDERAAALAKFLDLGADDVLEPNSYDDCEYTVNSRPVKEGTSPFEYMAAVRELKKLLTPAERRRITRLVKNAEAGKKGRIDSGKLYHEIEAAMLSRSDSWTDKQREAAANLKGAHMYVQNVLYWIVRRDFTDYEAKSHANYRKAWLGITPEDDRRDSTRDEGEYLVLTDSEADSRYDDALESLLDDIVRPELPENMQMYFDEEAWKRDARINGSRGEELNRYDGSEEWEDIDGETYYIYRTN